MRRRNFQCTVICLLQSMKTMIFHALTAEEKKRIRVWVSNNEERRVSWIRKPCHRQSSRCGGRDRKVPSLPVGLLTTSFLQSYLLGGSVLLGRSNLVHYHYEELPADKVNETADMDILVAALASVVKGSPVKTGMTFETKDSADRDVPSGDV